MADRKALNRNIECTFRAIVEKNSIMTFCSTNRPNVSIRRAQFGRHRTAEAESAGQCLRLPPSHLRRRSLCPQSVRSGRRTMRPAIASWSRIRRFFTASRNQAEAQGRAEELRRRGCLARQSLAVSPGESRTDLRALVASLGFDIDG